MPTRCALKKALLLTYSATTQTYNEAVADLRLNMGLVPKSEYDRLHDISEVARLAVEKARLELEKHVKMHGC